MKACNFRDVRVLRTGVLVATVGRCQSKEPAAMKCMRSIGMLALAAVAGSVAANVAAGHSGYLPTRAEPAATHAIAPAGVDVYATTDVGAGQRCLVGAISDSDGTHERPVVYLVKAIAGGVIWHAQLRIPHDYYQGRGTHCADRGNALYVLVQMDTESVQSVSQTLLRVVELDRKRGAIIATKDVTVPHAPSAYSAWVDEGNEHFRVTGDKLFIKGAYDLLSERDHPNGRAPTSFILALPLDLHP